MKSLLRRILDFFYRLLFGEDIFISYARDDGSEYARELFVRLTASEKRLTCYMDELGTEPGKKVPPSLLRKVRNCSMLVLVGSPCAAISDGVSDEIMEFLSVKRNRERIIPIDINQSIRTSNWAEIVAGIDLETEPHVDALEGKVGDSVIERIKRASGYRKQYDRLRLARNWTLTGLSFLLLLSGLAAALAYQQVKRAQEADAKARQASDNANAATAKANEAETNANLATARATVAQNAAAAAETQRGEAERKMKEAEAKRDQAEIVSKQQEAIAEARRLANQSAKEMELDVPKSVGYASESVRRVESNGLRLFEATLALRESLRIFPRQHEMRDAPKEGVLSPDGKYVAAKDSAGQSIGIFEARDLPDIFDKLDPKPVYKYSVETARGFVEQFAISDGFSRVAVVQKSSNEKLNFLVKDIRNQILLDSSALASYSTGLQIKSIALSPNGKFLAMVVNDPAKVEPGSGQKLPRTTDSIVLVDVDTKRFAPLYSAQGLDLATVSFGERGKCLIAVARATLGEAHPNFVKIGYVMIMRFPQDGPEKLVALQENVNPDFYPFEYINNAAISDDGRLLATTHTLGSVTIWELDPLRVVARLPMFVGSEHLRFSGNSETLITLGLSSLSTWDAKGYSAQSQSATWNEKLAKPFQTPRQTFSAFAVNGAISSVTITESDAKQEIPVVPHLLMAPRLNKNEDDEADEDQFNADRRLDPFLIAISSNGKILAALVQTRAGRAIQLYKRHNDRYIPHTLVRAGFATLSRVFQVPSLPGMQRPENPYQQIVVSPNGKYVACNCRPKQSDDDDLESENALCIWDVDQKRWMKRKVEKLSEQVRFRFSPNGKYLAAFGSHQNLVLFNIENLSEQRFVNPDLNNFDDVNFDRDENLIAAVATDGDVDVLTTRGLSRLSHLSMPKGVGQISFSRDGKKLLTHIWNSSYANGESWEVWELDNNRLIKEACWIMKSYKLHEPQNGVCK